MICVNCGRKVNENWNICPYCGHSIESQREDQISQNEDAGYGRERRNRNYNNRNINSRLIYGRRDGNEINDIWNQGEENIRSQRRQRDIEKIEYFGFAKFLIFSILTMNIYGLITMYRFNKSVNKLCEGDDQETPNYFLIILFSLLTLGIYMCCPAN